MSQETTSAHDARRGEDSLVSALAHAAVLAAWTLPPAAALARLHPLFDVVATLIAGPGVRRAARYAGWLGFAVLVAGELDRRRRARTALIDVGAARAGKPPARRA